MPPPWKCNTHLPAKFSENGEPLGELFESKELSAPRGVCLQNSFMFVAVALGNYSTKLTLLYCLIRTLSDVHGYIYTCNERWCYKSVDRLFLSLVTFFVTRTLFYFIAMAC